MADLGLLLCTTRSGSTIMGRILASMEPENIAWIFSFHPLGTSFHGLHNNAFEAGLCLNPKDSKLLSRWDVPFREKVAALYADAERQGRRLVLQYAVRPDFYYLPWRIPWQENYFAERNQMPGPENSILGLDELELSSFTVDRHRMHRRDWVQIWLSIETRHNNPGAIWWPKQLADPALETFEYCIRGLQQYDQVCQGIPTSYYEDFMADPDSEIQRICKNLGINYRSDWREVFRDFKFNGMGGDPRALSSQKFQPNTEAYKPNSEQLRQILTAGWSESRNGKFERKQRA